MKIKMVHPNLGAERFQWVDKEAFDLVWSGVGWEEVERMGETGDADDGDGVYIAPGVTVASPRPSWELDNEGKPLNPEPEGTPEMSVVGTPETEVKGPAKNRTNPPTA